MNYCHALFWWFISTFQFQMAFWWRYEILLNGADLTEFTQFLISLLWSHSHSANYMAANKSKCYTALLEICWNLWGIHFHWPTNDIHIRGQRRRRSVRFACLIPCLNTTWMHPVHQSSRQRYLPIACWPPGETQHLHLSGYAQQLVALLMYRYCLVA